MSSDSKKEEFLEKSVKKRQGGKLVRCFLATKVQSIYKSWGMSDTQFYKYMGEYLNITPDGVRKFLHKRKNLHKDLLTYERLSDALEKIFNQYISNENIDSEQKEKAVETWALNHDKCMKELKDACTCLCAISVCKTLEKVVDDWYLFLLDEDDTYSETIKWRGFKLFVNFLSGNWPGDTSLGLPPPQVEELKRAAKEFISVWLDEKDVEVFIQEISQLIFEWEI